MKKPTYESLVMPSMGPALELVRIALGWTRHQLATELGISRSTVNRWCARSTGYPVKDDPSLARRANYGTVLDFLWEHRAQLPARFLSLRK